MPIAPFFSTPPPSTPAIATGLGVTFPPRNINNIGDALAATSGLSQNGTITNALHPQTPSQGIGAPNPNLSLAATINPAANLLASASLRVTDFINTSPNAFPPLTPPPEPSTPVTPGTSTDNNTSGTQSTDNAQTKNTNNSSFNTPAPSPAPTSSATAGIYNAVAGASTSTIRGSTLNVTA